MRAADLSASLAYSSLKYRMLRHWRGSGLVACVTCVAAVGLRRVVSGVDIGANAGFGQAWMAMGGEKEEFDIE